MAQTVTCRFVDCPDGRFAVLAVLSSGSVYRCGGLLTLAEANASVETLRALLAAFGAQLVAEASEGFGTGVSAAQSE